MWVEALWFFARNEEAPTDCISDLLKHIDELDVLPPLMVLEILSHSHAVTLGLVKVSHHSLIVLSIGRHIPWCQSIRETFF